MNSGLAQILAVIAAGFSAGAINAVAAGGTLIAFPVLLWAGVPPYSANIACSIGLLPGYASGAYGYRHVMDQVAAIRTRLIVVASAGGVVGALLLIVTPRDSFTAVVPYLVLFSVALFAARPWLTRVLQARGSGPQLASARMSVALGVCIFLAGAYGSYFGAALGIVLLTILGTLLHSNMKASNGMKSVLSFCCVAAGACLFIVAGRVDWLPAALLVVSSTVGGFVGARVGLRVPDVALRWIVIVMGTSASIGLFVRG